MDFGEHPLSDLTHSDKGGPWITSNIELNRVDSQCSVLVREFKCVFNVKSNNHNGQKIAVSALLWNQVTHTHIISFSLSFSDTHRHIHTRIHRHTEGGPYLCEVEIEQTQGEELQADGAAVEQPVGQRLQLVGLHHIFKVKREEGRPQRCPQQTQEQKHALVAEALVSVVQNEPELQVDENKQERVEDGVDGCQTELQCWGNCSFWGLLQWGKQMGINLLLSCRKHLHWKARTNTWDAGEGKKQTHTD